jgi:DNA-binding PadR family transcriptional regulator
MTNAEVAILCLLAEQPLYGYQIEQLIEQRGMRQWTEIGFSSIYYILNKLEENGWLSAEKCSDGDRPVRKVYQLTAGGAAGLRQAVSQRLRAPRARSGDLDLALACLPVLPLNEVLAALTESRAGLEQRMKEVNIKQAVGQQAASLPFHVKSLFDHSLVLMQAELDWIDRFIIQLKQME